MFMKYGSGIIISNLKPPCCCRAPRLPDLCKIHMMAMETGSVPPMGPHFSCLCFRHTVNFPACRLATFCSSDCAWIGPGISATGSSNTAGLRTNYRHGYEMHIAWNLPVCFSSCPCVPSSSLFCTREPLDHKVWSSCLTD